MNPLEHGLAEYLTLRHSLGYKLERAGQLLADFVAFAAASGAEHLTTDLALSWAVRSSNPQSGWRAQRLGAVRCFARYLHAVDPLHEVPPTRLLPPGQGRPAPLLYSPEQVAALMTAARRLASPLRAATLETVIGLLAVTGLRVGELMALDIDDVEFDTGLLVVKTSKTNRSRLVALHESSLDALRAYLAERERLVPPDRGRSLFVSTAGTRLSSEGLGAAFAEVVALAGLAASRDGKRPRLGGFRHSFAVQRLLNWHEDGRDVQAMLPVLSCFLGHVSPASTYWYLSASPELLAAAARRVERTLGLRP